MSDVFNIGLFYKLDNFWGISLLILFGFILGYFLIWYYRLIPFAWFLGVGIIWVRFSEHFFNIYKFALGIFIVSILVGQYLKSKKTQKSLNYLNYLDCVVGILMLIVLSMLYKTPFD